MMQPMLFTLQTLCIYIAPPALSPSDDEAESNSAAVSIAVGSVIGILFISTALVVLFVALLVKRKRYQQGKRISSDLWYRDG